MGQKVNLSTSSWMDMDIYIPEGGAPTQEPDEMGVVEWFLEGPGELNWPPGQAVTYTAPISRIDTTVCIHMWAHDSGTKGLDPPAYDNVNFNILVPNSVRAWQGVDSPLGTPGPPNNSMRAAHVFNVQILPDTVNFVWVDFNERIEPQSFPWPNKTKSRYVVGGENGENHPIQVQDMGEDTPNYFSDAVTTGGPWDVQRLFNIDTQQYEPCTFIVVVALQFFAEGQWNEFVRPVHPRYFSAPDFQANVGWNGGGSTPWGNPQGPYREIEQ